jgi:hypothetical protein
MEKVVIYAAQDRALPGLNSLVSQDLNSPEESDQNNVSLAAQNKATTTLPEPPALKT